MNKVLVLFAVFFTALLFKPSLGVSAELDYAEHSCQMLADEYESNDDKIKFHKAFGDNFRVNVFDLAFGLFINPDKLFTWDEKYDYEKLEKYQLEKQKIKYVMQSKDCPKI